MIKVIKLKRGDWKTYKSLRLRALQKNPLAFGATYLEEAKKPDSFWIERIQECFFVSEGGKLVGMARLKFAKMKKFSHISKLGGVYIDSSHRGRGAGELLVKKMIKTAFEKKGVTKIKLTVNKSQKAAIKLYLKCGFKKVGVMKKEFFIKGKFYDAYLMELVH